MTDNKELLASTQALLASHQATCPNFRAVPRKDCALCDGILKLAADIMAVMPPEPFIIPVDQVDPDILKHYMAPAVAAIARKIEGDLLDLYAGFTGQVGNA